MWYTLPWKFDEFFHQYVPKQWISGVHVFHVPFHRMHTTNRTCLRTLDATDGNLPWPISHLPDIVSFDRIETLHLSFWNKPIDIPLSTLRNMTLVNSVNCLNNCCSIFAATIRSIRILLFPHYPNYTPPNWSVVLHSLSTFSQLSSLRVFIYDLPKPIDDESCQMIAKVVPIFSDFGFYFRYKSGSTGDEIVDAAFKNHQKFIRQLLNRIRLLFSDKQPYSSIEDGTCGLAVWS